jgi:hypothetical protein
VIRSDGLLPRSRDAVTRLALAEEAHLEYGILDGCRSVQRHACAIAFPLSGRGLQAQPWVRVPRRGVGELAERSVPSDHQGVWRRRASGR